MKTKFLDMKKSLTLALVLILITAIVMGSFALFTDRAKSNTLNISTATFTKDGYTISREFNDVYYVAGDTISVNIKESNAKNEPVQSVVTMSVKWTSPDTSCSPFGNANAADNAVIKIDGTVVDYTVNADGTITFALPAHKMNSNSADNERNLTFLIPDSLKSTGKLDFTFNSVKLSQTTAMGDTGFYAEYNHDDLNPASNPLDFNAKVIWDFSAAQDKSVVGYLTGSNSNLGIQVEGTGAMYDWASGTASKQSQYKGSVKSISIGDGITTIGDNAFNGFGEVTSIVIPKDVAELGAMSFGNCGKLTTITFNQDSADNITFPTAGSSTGAFYVPSYLKTTFNFNGNADAKGYDWVTDNRMKVGITDATLAYDDVKVGETVDPQLGLNPANHDDFQSIKYEVISGSEYAEVDPDTGVVTGLKKGTATIKVTIVDANGDTVTAQGNVKVYLDPPMLAPQNSWQGHNVTKVVEDDGYTYYNFDSYIPNKDAITTISIVDSYTPDGTESASWDASDPSVPGTVTAYLNADGTVLTIAGNGYGLIFANPDSSYAFSDTSDAFSYFNSVTAINNLDLLDTRNTTNMSAMFYRCKGLTSLDVHTFNVSKVTDMSSMFADCGKLVTIDLSSNTATFKDGSGTYEAWNPTSVQRVDYLFSMHGGRATALESINVTGWKTNSLTNMFGMFMDCTVLTEIKGFSDWNTSNVEDMGLLFQDCYNLETIDVSKWNTEKLQNAYRMFQYCSSLKSIDISNWNMSSMTNTQEMFYSCNSLTELTLPASLSLFGNKFAAACYNLTEITFLQSADMDITLPTAGNSTGAFSAYNTYSPSNPLGTKVITSNDKILNYDWASDARGWTVTVESVAGGTLAADAKTAINGKTITLTPTADSGRTYNGATYSYTDENGAVLNFVLDADTLTFTMPAANVTITPKWLVDTPTTPLYPGQAIYSATDDSLTFVNDKIYSPGDTYNGKVVTEVYTGFEEDVYTTYSEVPWYSKRTLIKSVVVADEIKPVSTAFWFANFENCSSFDVTKLNTSEVTNMYDMFYVAGKNVTSTFHISDMSSWDTSKVETMYGMFWGAGKVAKTWDVGDFGKWDVSNVTNMSHMFYYAGTSASNVVLDLSSWNTSKVTTMNQMFKGFTGLTRVYATHRFNTDAVTDGTDMFSGTSNIVGGEGTKYSSSNITKAYAHVDGVDSKPGYFTNNIFLAYDSPIEVGETTDPQLTILSTVFKDYTSIKYEIVSGSECATINENTGVVTGKANGKAVVKVTLGASNGDTITAEATVYIGDVAQAIYSSSDKSLTFIRDRLYSAGETYNGKAVTAVYTGFETDSYASGSETPWYSNRNNITSVVIKDQMNPVSTAYWFYGFDYCTSFNVANLNTANVTNMKGTFWNAGNQVSNFKITGLDTWNVSNVTDMSYMFCYAGNNATTCNIGNLSTWNVSNVKDFSYMFSYTMYNAQSFKLDLSGWDTSSGTNMSRMFLSAGYSATTWSIGDLSSWDTSSAVDMSSMFARAGYSATTFNIGNIGSWDVSKVVYFGGSNITAGTQQGMFSEAGYSATTWSIGDLSSWDTSSAVDMSGMFCRAGNRATTFNIGDIGNWDVSHVTNFGRHYSNINQNSGMFASAGQKATTFKIGDLSKWDTSSAIYMSGMFSNAGENATYKLNLSGWNVSKVTEAKYFNTNVTAKVTTPKFNSGTTLSLRPTFTLPEGVTAGKSQGISSMPDVTKLNESAAAAAPANTSLYGWLVDSGLAQEVVLLDEFDDVLHSVYDEIPDYELTITPLYQVVEDTAVEETQPTETTEPTETSEATEETEAATEPSVGATEPTKAVEETQPTAASEPTEVTTATEPSETEANVPVTEPTEEATDLTKATEETQPAEATESTETTEATKTMETTAETSVQASEPTQQSDVTEPSSETTEATENT